MDTTVFLSQLKEIQAIATAPTKDTVARNERALAKIREFNKAYPSYAPISRDSMQKVFRTPSSKFLPNRAELKIYSVLPKDSRIMYEQSTTFEELIPNVRFPIDRQHLVNTLKYTDEFNRPTFVMVIDRGYLGGWTRAAHWYYLTRHFVGADRKPYFEAEYKFNDDKDINGNTILTLWADSSGHAWTAWHNVINNPHQRRHNYMYYPRTSYFSYWKDRWEIVLENSNAFELDSKAVFDSAWFKTVQ